MISNIEKIKAVLNFTEEMFGKGGSGESLIEEFLSGSEVLVENDKYTVDAISTAACIAFYAEYATKNLEEKNAILLKTLKQSASALEDAIEMLWRADLSDDYSLDELRNEYSLSEIETVIRNLE